jgi:hypothetical protein
MGSVTAEQGFESVHIGKQDSQYSAPHMPFWQVVSHEMPTWDEKSHFSGIIGLGHTSTVPEGYTSRPEPEETMLSAMGVSNFALCLERSGPEAPGWLIFGPTVDAQSSGVAGQFQSLTVVGKAHWGVKLTGFRAQGLDIEDPCRPSCGAIVDSGSSLISVPRSAIHIVKALEAKVKSDCSNLQQLPVLEMQLGEALIELPPKAYVMQVQVEAPKNSTIYKKLGPFVIRECFTAFMTIDKESDYGPMWVLGMPFLRYYYTVFDRTSKRIHIAKASPDCKTPLSDSIVQSSRPLNESTWLLNATQHLGARSYVGTGRAFAAADYEPTKVDLSEVRVPGWTISEDAGRIHL